MADVLYCSLFFFSKQKTAYEMRISDWSSDVCSSDLVRDLGRFGPAPDRNAAKGIEDRLPRILDRAAIHLLEAFQEVDRRVGHDPAGRHDIDPNTPPPPFLGQRLAVGPERGLGSGLGCGRLRQWRRGRGACREREWQYG